MRLRLMSSRTAAICFWCAKAKLCRGEEAEYLYNLITKRNAENVTVDLGSVSYIDEGGSIMLLLCHSLLADTRRKLFFQNPSAAAMEGFRLRQLDSIFGLADVPAPVVPLTAMARNAAI